MSALDASCKWPSGVRKVMSKNVLTVVPANAVSLRGHVRGYLTFMTEEALTCSVVVATMVE